MTIELIEAKEACFYLEVKSDDFPFISVGKRFSDLEKANIDLQDFVRLIEKKFDSIWYMGTDYFGSELFERFMFHRGGFMEISLNGEIRVYFREDKIEKFKEALNYAIEKMSSETRASRIVSSAKTGKKLISLKESLFSEVK